MFMRADVVILSDNEEGKDDHRRRANENEDEKKFRGVIQYKSNGNHRVSVMNDVCL